MIHPKIDITPKQAKLGPLIGSTVNWDQLREWLQDCTTNHEDCACIAGKGVPKGFRLIDVRRRCLTPELDQDTDISYAALSYVWGSDPDNGKLKGHMVERPESPNSLDDVPKTIEDALIICSELGYQYLWVDRLCIVQDDFEKKQGQINSMAQIFSSAAVTIVTAACKDMDSPVPGVSLERSKHQRQVQIADLHFTSTPQHRRLRQEGDPLHPLLHADLDMLAGQSVSALPATTVPALPLHRRAAELLHARSRRGIARTAFEKGILFPCSSVGEKCPRGSSGSTTGCLKPTHPVSTSKKKR